MSKTTKEAVKLTLSPKVLLTVSFIEGAAVMGVELIGAKMIGPFFGSSLYVWAAVLAVTLFGLAVGYFAGGVLSKKYAKPDTLFYVIAASAILVAIMPGWGNIVMKMCLSLDVQTASLVATMLFLFPPLVCFGMVSPLIINLVNHSENHAGRSAGTVYAISTLGGILMTLLIGFYMIPNYGMRMSAYFVAGVLALIPIIYFIGRRKFMVPLGVAMLTVACTYAGSKVVRVPSAGQNAYFTIFEISDGLLGQIMVAEAKDQQRNIHYRSLHVNNISQTKMHMGVFRSEWAYVHRIALYASHKPAGSKVLVCGLGGGNLINELYVLGFQVDAVELDPRMERVAKQYFGMTEDANVIIDDARHYIKTTQQKYDIVVLDMTAGENQPSHVYTVEGFKEIQALMNPGGVMFVHYQNAREGEHALAAKSIMRTMEESGFHTALIQTFGDRTTYNEIIMYASLEPVTLHEESFERRNKFADGFGFPMGEEIYDKQFTYDEGLILTDDLPVMDVLHLNTLQVVRGPDFNIQTLNLLGNDVEFI